MHKQKSSAGRAGSRGVKWTNLAILQDALFLDPYAKALSGDGLGMSDRLGEAASQFGFDNWPEFHKVLISGGLAAPSTLLYQRHTYQIISVRRSYPVSVGVFGISRCSKVLVPCLGRFGPGVDSGSHQVHR